MKCIVNGHRLIYRAATLIITIAILITLSTQIRAASETCAGVNVNLPFEDIAGNGFFCQIAAAYFSGLTNGTSATTYSPGAPVAREQMAAFVTRTLDQSLKRGSRRAALDQWWMAKDGFQAEKRGSLNHKFVNYVKSDGKDLWVTSEHSMFRVDPVTGNTAAYTNMDFPRGILFAMGYVFTTGVSGGSSVLYRIDPRLAIGSFGSLTTVTTNLVSTPLSITFDGRYIWTANAGGSISIIDPSDNYSVITNPLGIQPAGILFDGKNIWVTDGGNGNLLKLDSFGFVIQTVGLGGDAAFPTFDGTNIWVPDPGAGKLYVVRASTGTLLATLQPGGQHNFNAAAFDGERVAVTDTTGSIHLWNAANLAYLGNCQVNDSRTPVGICSDGTRFWATMTSNQELGYLLGL